MVFYYFNNKTKNLGVPYLLILALKNQRIYSHLSQDSKTFQKKMLLLFLGKQSTFSDALRPRKKATSRIGS